MAMRGSASLLFFLGLSTAITVGACAHSDPIDDGSNGEPDPNGTQSDESPICLLHNCSEDAHCGGCTEGRNTCLVDEGRCVACDATTQTGCPEGEVCSSWGNCVPEGLECPADDHGIPQVVCASNADCAACDPMHQVCDTASAACVACTTSDTSACQSTDSCVDGSCNADCPASCNDDGDCASCGGPGAEAHACNAHQCAECSATVPCSGGLVCTPEGTCEGKCGSDGNGACSTDADCDGCGAEVSSCNNGTCGIQAGGCSDLGAGSLALPEPWSDYTNTCSNDNDCAGVGAILNIGKVLRDITGIDEINDANITYGMNVCAAVSIGDTSCGLCVPCREDSDCAPIDVDEVASDAFGPIGSLAAAFLLDQVFGPNDHQVNMYCQGVAGGYGVCAPCPGVFYACGVDDPGGGGGGGGGSGTCDHAACEVGSALDGSCDACAADLCAVDSYCCDTEWDDVCVSEVAQYCPAEDCGGGGGGGTQTGSCHDECTEGDAMDVGACGACVDAICDYDSYCCDTTWDSYCVGYVDQLCSPGC